MRRPATLLLAALMLLAGALTALAATPREAADAAATAAVRRDDARATERMARVAGNETKAAQGTATVPAPTDAPTDAPPTATGTPAPTDVATASPSPLPPTPTAAPATATAIPPTATAPATATTTATPAPAPSATPAPDRAGFVAQSGGRLSLDGKPFTFVGLNSSPDTVDYPYQGCGQGYSDADVETLYGQLQAAGVTVDRMWAMQPWTSSATNYARLDYALAVAQKHNVHLILTIGNQWGDCDDHVNKRADWYESGYLSPAGDDPMPYYQYALALAARYAGNPAILAWELMNEPQARDSGGACRSAALTSFARTMSDAIRQKDPNHLIAVGAYDGCIHGGDQDLLNSLPNIGLVLGDDYNQSEVALPTSSPDPGRSLAGDLAAANRVGRAFAVGEGGIKSNCADPDCYTEQRRAELFAAKFRAFRDAGAAGYTVWAYAYNKTSLDVNDVNSSDPLLATIRAFVTGGAASTPTPVPTATSTAAPATPTALTASATPSATPSATATAATTPTPSPSPAPPAGRALPDTTSGVHIGQSGTGADGSQGTVVVGGVSYRDMTGVDYVYGARRGGAVGMQADQSWNAARGGPPWQEYYSAWSQDQNYAGEAPFHDLNWYKANHPDWVLYMADKTTPGYYGAPDTGYTTRVSIDYTNPAVQRYMYDTFWVPAFKAGFDGISFDDNTSYNLYRAVGCYCGAGGAWLAKYSGDREDAAWKDAQADAAKQIRALIKASYPNKSITLENGWFPTWDTSAAVYQGINQYADIVEDEGGWYANGTSDRILARPGKTSANEWLDKMTYYQNLGKAGVGVFWINQVKGYDINRTDSTPGSQTRSDLQWAMANYLLAKQAGAPSFMGMYWDGDAGGYGEPTKLFPEYATVRAIGAPAGEMVAAGGVYSRAFAGGLAIVNPDPANSHTVNVGAGYRDLYGAATASVTLAPGTAIVLLKG